MNNKVQSIFTALLLGVCAAVGYAVLLDEVTVRLCLEYFTVGHEPIFGTHSATVLGLLWGTTAGVFPGIAIGAVLAYVTTSGTAPQIPARSLVRPTLILLCIMAAAALISGFAGYSLCRLDLIGLPPIYASRLDPAKHAPFMADWCAHGASYLVGYAGSVVIIRRAWRTRRNRPKKI